MDGPASLYSCKLMVLLQIVSCWFISMEESICAPFNTAHVLSFGAITLIFGLMLFNCCVNLSVNPFVILVPPLRITTCSYCSFAAPAFTTLATNS